MAFFKLFPQLADTFFFGFGQGLVGPHSFGEAVKEFLPRRLPEVKISLAAGFGIAIGHFKGHGIGTYAAVWPCRRGWAADPKGVPG